MIAPLILILLALIGGLVFLGMRRIEHVRGMRYGEAKRAVLDTHAAYLWQGMVEGGIPLAWREYGKALAHALTHEVVHIAVEVVREVERPLARLSYKMRVSAPKTPIAPVSDFLRTLTPAPTPKGRGSDLS